MPKIRTGEKWCWLAREHKDGWTVSVSTNKRDYRVGGLRLATKKDVSEICNGSIMFVHMGGQ